MDEHREYSCIGEPCSTAKVRSQLQSSPVYDAISALLFSRRPRRNAPIRIIMQLVRTRLGEHFIVMQVENFLETMFSCKEH